MVHRVTHCHVSGTHRCPIAVAVSAAPARGRPRSAAGQALT